MPPSQPKVARLINWFSMPVDVAVFSGTPGITGLATLPKARVLLAAAMDRRVVCCDLSAPVPTTRAPIGPIVPAKHSAWAHDNWVHDLDVHPDGKRVATGGYDRHVKIWRWGEDKPIADVKAHDDWVRVVSFSPDGKLLASAGDDGFVRLWDADGKSVTAFDAGAGRLDVLAWSSDSKQLLSSGNDGVLRYWSVESRQVLRSIDLDNRRLIEDEPLNGGFSYPGGLRGLACSPDGKLVAAVGLTSLHVLDFASGKEVLKVYGRGFGVAFAPDSKRLAFSQEKDLLVYDLTTKQISHRMPGDQLGLFAMFFLDEGKRLAAGGCNGRVGLWDLS